MDEKTGQTDGQNDQLDSSSAPAGSATMPLPSQLPAYDASSSPIPAQAPPMTGSAPLAPPDKFPHASLPSSANQASSPPPATTSESEAEEREAADADTIERVWIDQIKTIVADTQGDPYRQVLEIQKLKAEYMKKRYNKDIKLEDA